MENESNKKSYCNSKKQENGNGIKVGYNMCTIELSLKKFFPVEKEIFDYLPFKPEPDFF